uniref:CTCK domain-containing protein n=2 Tax=Echeneis naucrates TaxID=173247 RepID=A0A665WE84_ECHNA
MNGCCKTCKIRSVCEVQSEQKVIEVNNCKSAQPVTMNFCAGHCGSSSMYSAASNSMVYNCECCREESSVMRQVELICADGSKVQHYYSKVRSCSCKKSECTTGSSEDRRRR